MENEDTENKRIIIPALPLRANSAGFIMHVIGSDSSGMPIFGPYKIGEYARDIEEHARALLNAHMTLRDPQIPLYTRFAKFLNVGSEEGYLELDSQDGVLFLLGDGEFPIGCGARDLCTIMAARPRTNNADYIARKIEADIRVRISPRATGKLKVDEQGVHISEFTPNFFGDFRNYTDIIRALTHSKASYVAKDGTPILFKVNMEKEKEMEFIKKDYLQ